MDTGKLVHYLEDYNLPERGQFLSKFGKISHKMPLRVFIEAYIRNGEIVYYSDGTDFPRGKEEIFSLFVIRNDSSILEMAKNWINSIECKVNRENKLEILLND